MKAVLWIVLCYIRSTAGNEYRLTVPKDSRQDTNTTVTIGSSITITCVLQNNIQPPLSLYGPEGLSVVTIRETCRQQIFDDKRRPRIGKVFCRNNIYKIEINQIQSADAGIWFFYANYRNSQKLRIEVISGRETKKTTQTVTPRTTTPATTTLRASDPSRTVRPTNPSRTVRPTDRIRTFRPTDRIRTIPTADLPTATLTLVSPTDEVQSNLTEYSTTSQSKTGRMPVQTSPLDNLIQLLCGAAGVLLLLVAIVVVLVVIVRRRKQSQADDYDVADTGGEYAQLSDDMRHEQETGTVNPIYETSNQGEGGEDEGDKDTPEMGAVYSVVQKPPKPKRQTSSQNGNLRPDEDVGAVYSVVQMAPKKQDVNEGGAMASAPQNHGEEPGPVVYSVVQKTPKGCSREPNQGVGDVYSMVQKIPKTDGPNPSQTCKEDVGAVYSVVQMAPKKQDVNEGGAMASAPQNHGEEPGPVVYSVVQKTPKGCSREPNQGVGDVYSMVQKIPKTDGPNPSQTCKEDVGAVYSVVQMAPKKQDVNEGGAMASAPQNHGEEPGPVVYSVVQKTPKGCSREPNQGVGDVYSVVQKIPKTDGPNRSQTCKEGVGDVYSVVQKPSKGQRQ